MVESAAFPFFLVSHCLESARVAALNLNRDLVSENSSSQTCPQLLLTLYASPWGPPSRKLEAVKSFAGNSSGTEAPLKPKVS